jgi:phosphoribosylformylglycinamidine (FGAM) synthase PurS component
VLKSELKEGEVSIQVRHGDMTTEEVDAIVNAANSSLDHACKQLLVDALIEFLSLKTHF